MTRLDGFINKGWGSELIWATNDKYCGKLLKFNKDARFSMHFHAEKDESWYVLDGLFKVVFIETQDASQHEAVVSSVKKFSEVLEVHYTTGRYSLLTKIVAKDMDDLFLFMSTKLQVIPSITSTETFLVLHSYFDREMDASRLTRNARSKA